jgi:hypothetical protein
MVAGFLEKEESGGAESCYLLAIGLGVTQEPISYVVSVAVAYKKH